MSSPMLHLNKVTFEVKADGACHHVRWKSKIVSRRRRFRDLGKEVVGVGGWEGRMGGGGERRRCRERLGHARGERCW